jgi:hypothetical protein
MGYAANTEDVRGQDVGLGVGGVAGASLISLIIRLEVTLMKRDTICYTKKGALRPNTEVSH